jgi:hypothetical protein
VLFRERSTFELVGQLADMNQPPTTDFDPWQLASTTLTNDTKGSHREQRGNLLG